MTAPTLGAYFYWCGGPGYNGGVDGGNTNSFSTMATHSNGSVYSAEDLNNRCQQFTKSLGFTKITAASQSDCLDVTCSAYDNNVYMIDRATVGAGGNKVHICQPDGTLVRAWHGGAHPILDLNSITLDGIGNVYVADNTQPEMRVYDTLGNWISTPTWGGGIWGQKTQALSYDGSKIFLSNGGVLNTSDGSTFKTLVDNNGNPLSGVQSVYLPPGGLNNNVWYTDASGNIFRYTQLGVLTGAFTINMNGLTTPSGSAYTSATTIYGIPSVDELWYYVDVYPSPYLMAFSVGGSGNKAPVVPRGRGAGW